MSFCWANRGQGIAVADDGTVLVLCLHRLRADLLADPKCPQWIKDQAIEPGWEARVALWGFRVAQGTVDCECIDVHLCFVDHDGEDKQ